MVIFFFHSIAPLDTNQLNANKKGEIRSDEALIKDYQKGDAKAFDILYKRYIHSTMKQIGYSLHINMDEAEELAQDLMVSLYHSILKFRHKATFKTYLYQSIKNTVLQYKKTHRLNKIRQSSQSIENIQAERTGHSHRDAFISDVKNIIAQLPEKMQQVFIIKELENHTFKETAEICGLTMRHCQTLKESADNILRDELRKHGFNPGDEL